MNNLDNNITTIRKRSLPVNYYAFCSDYFPISNGTIKLINRAKYPFDWLTNFLLHSTSGLVTLIFVQYGLSVLHYGAIETAFIGVLVGLSLGILAPLYSSKFHPVPLATYTMLLFVIGLLILSIAGTGINEAPIIGGIGIFICALGAPYVPALQTNILGQYLLDEQGEVSGMLGQQNNLSLLPAYIMSLGFTMSVNHNKNDVIYWPGSAFGAVNIFFLIFNFYYLIFNI